MSESSLEPRPALDPCPEEMRRLGYRAVDLIVDHLAALSEKPVVRAGNARELGRLVDEPLPDRGKGPQACLDFFAERVLPRTTLVNHPRFHGYIPCPGSFASTLGAMLAAGTNPFTGSWLGGGSLAALEVTVLRWVAEAVGYSGSPHLGEPPAGILTSGGSIANLIGLAAARARAGAESWQHGTIYVSREGHASVTKAARLLGLPDKQTRRVAVDGSYRMRCADLARMIDHDRAAGLSPILVCANAGTTNTGAIDPLDEIAALCRARHLWLHVDGAYGGFAAVTPHGRKCLAGIDRADSLTLDPHKWFYASMGTGCVLTQDRSALERAFSSDAAYMRDIPTNEVNFHERGPELSRPARVLGLWFLIRSAGLSALADQIACDLRLALLAADLIAEDQRFELVCRPQLSVVVFRHRARPDESEAARAARDSALMESTLRDGSVMLSSTVLDGKSALRLVIMNHRTNEAELRRSIETIRKLAG